jgi:hypothetical protein
MLFNIWDPRYINVVLHERVYENHIVARHGDEVSIADIQYVIENPNIITADVSDVLVENYYGKGVIPSADPSEWLKVCTRYEGEGLRVVTAYLVDRPKSIERVLWTHRP